ncbi:MAG: Coenzyme F420 hydrogenase/dehydrogenase, beta subunit C-terminal domain, partial [Clostridia bacterium]|nr:Coenzyme F420 hydrogenase/dehydrogenase, beta subunit C-terminal domain [Clostridia bacterium]
VKYFINWLLKETDMSVCLIPHVYTTTSDLYHDLPILKRLFKEINSPRISIVDKEYDCEQLKYIISKCRYFIGARTHSTIAAYSMKIPTLVIGYSVKSKGIATDLFGQYENFVLPFKELQSDDELLNAFILLVKNEKWIKQRYEEFLPCYKQSLLDAVNNYLLCEKSIDKTKKEYICDIDQCSGCSACLNTCSVNAITMQQNKQGFLYPKIDIEKCINCNLCRNTCPVVNKFLDSQKEPLTFAAKNKNNIAHYNSSSGGIFPLLATHIIENNGVVFAPAFDSNYVLKHTLVDKLEDITKIVGSKYVQSDINDCYKQVLNVLEQGKKVLFSGTPCQVYGLKRFLKKDYQNLITQDLVCHGVPSPDSWKNYLEFIKKKNHDEHITNIVFREKQTDGNSCIKIEFSNGKIYKCNYANDPFIKSYLSNLNLRSSCLDCSFKQLHRNSDITLGDFWGIGSLDIEMSNNKNVSLLMVHSNQGTKLINEIKDELEIIAVNNRDAIKHNTSYLCSTKENPFRNDFLTKVTSKNFDKKVRKYAGSSFFSKLRRRIKNFFNSCRK